MNFKLVLEELSKFSVWSVLFRIVLATILGGLIGLERENVGRAAGLRTYILVCLGATVTVLVELYTVYDLGLTSDPMRLSAQVISGIGFLGAGTILTRNDSQVIGLTTAAGLWTTACIGLAVGIGFYWLAGISFGVEFLSMSLLKHLVHHKEIQTYYVEVDERSALNQVCDLLSDHGYTQKIVPAASGAAENVGIVCTDTAVSPDDPFWDEVRHMEHIVFAVSETKLNGKRKGRDGNR